MDFTGPIWISGNYMNELSYFLYSRTEGFLNWVRTHVYMIIITFALKWNSPEATCPAEILRQLLP